MRHWLFLSYARKNLAPAPRGVNLLEKFHSDLKLALDQAGTWEEGSGEEPIFFDRESLQLMADWDEELERALQTSRVFTCMLSPAYVMSEFCAKEFWLFDTRRGEAATPAPPVILPIVWIPIDPLPSAIAAVQFDHRSLPDEYRRDGLLRLMQRRQWGLYTRCIQVFADAILKAGRAHPYMAPKQTVPSFEHMPLAFEPETSRARFAFVTAARNEFADSVRQHRYFERGDNWKPFDPPVPHTVRQISSDIAFAQNMAYGELPADRDLADLVRSARPRDRVVLVVDPWTICLDHHRSRIPPPTVLGACRASVIVPFPDADALTPAERDEIERALDDAFPRLEASGGPPYERTTSVGGFRAALARGLATSHLAKIAAAAERNPSTDTITVVSSSAANPNG